MHELVIFDCDGVLVDSEVISNEVLARMLTREGLSTTLREARHDYQGLLLADIRSRAEAKLGRSLPAGWLAEYEHERAEAFRHGLEPVAGAAEAVGRVKAAGMKVCVASQGALELWRYRHKDNYVVGRVMSRWVLRSLRQRHAVPLWSDARMSLGPAEDCGGSFRVAAFSSRAVAVACALGAATGGALRVPGATSLASFR
jgi:Haloacid dehalogenase-like hydrolase